MTQVEVEIFLPASPDDVWEVVGAFDQLHRWHPLVPNCRMGEDGRSRVIEIPGSEVIETLDPEACGPRRHVYRVGQTPMPIRDYLALLEVRDAPGGAVVFYRGTFEPEGVPEEVAKSMIEQFFDTGFQALATRFSG